MNRWRAVEIGGVVLFAFGLIFSIASDASPSAAVPFVFASAAAIGGFLVIFGIAGRTFWEGKRAREAPSP